MKRTQEKTRRRRKKNGLESKLKKKSLERVLSHPLLWYGQGGGGKGPTGFKRRDARHSKEKPRVCRERGVKKNPSGPRRDPEKEILEMRKEVGRERRQRGK